MLESGDAVVIPVILGLVQILKRLGMSSNWAPVASIVLGLLASFVYMQPGDLAKTIVDGVIVGLSAMGLWSGPKAVVQSLKSR